MNLERLLRVLQVGMGLSRRSYPVGAVQHVPKHLLGTGVFSLPRWLCRQAVLVRNLLLMMGDRSDGVRI